MYFNKKIAAIAAGIIVPLGIGIATTATASTTQPTPIPNNSYCVTFGHGPTAAGNVVEYNWDRMACPVNTYPKTIGSSDDFAADSQEFLPQIFGTGQQSNGNFNVTNWFIDDITGRYICQFKIPTPTPAVDGTTNPTIVCTRLS